jgi:hypothetical protein
MQAGAASTGTAFAKWSNQTAGAAKVSAEGLGFVSQALGRVSPQLALLGEQSTKQLPTIMSLGQSMSKYVFAGGALATIGASAGKVAYEMSQISKGTITADSHLGQLLATSNDISPNSFFGRLLNGTFNRALNAFGTSLQEVEEQQRDLKLGASWKIGEGIQPDKDADSKKASEELAKKLREQQAQRANTGDNRREAEG